MALTGFLFPGKNIKEQKFCLCEKYGYHGSFMGIILFALGGTSRRDFASG
jgi:hypothetical protein